MSSRRCAVFLPFAVLLAVSIHTAHAQTNVDRLVQRFDELSMAAVNDWKVSPDLKTSPIEGNAPARPDFDDSGWTTLKLDARLYIDSCWIRKRIVLPATLAGQPVRGPLRFLVTVNDYGFLWVNGEERGRINWDGEFVLSNDAKPGDVLSIAIKVVNTAGALQLIRADFRLQEGGEAHREISDFALSMRVAQKLLGFDTYQTNARNRVDPGIDKSTASPEEKRRLNALLQELATRVDTDALERGDLERFRASLAVVRRELDPIRRFAKTYTLFFSANAHIDAAWLWRERETIAVCKNTFSSVMNMFEARPDFTYSQSSAAYYDWMERLEPQIFRAIRDRVREGRWEITGGMWIEPDCNLPSGESWARHLLYAKRYFRQKFDVDVKVGWNPDSFGYHWNMPQLYRSAGIDAFITQKIGWNEKNVFPHRAFWWEGPDGSRVLAYFPFDYVNTVDNPYRLTDWLRQHDANTGLRRMFILFGVGDHGGGPSLEMIDRIERLKGLDVYPAIEYGTASQYLAWLKRQDLSALPVWRDELYLEYHQGTYTTQAKVKEANRRGEVLLTNTEKFATLATLSGGSYPGAPLEEAWRQVLFNQFHDILPGSSIREVYLDAPERYRDAQIIAEHELDRALDRLAAGIDTSRLGKGTPVVVWNPLSWERNDVVRLSLADGDADDYAVFDASGREVPVQAVATGRFSREILFVADEVPPLGYALYEIRRQKPSATASPLVVSNSTIENGALRVEIDPVSGWVKSILEKRSGREVLASEGNRLQLLEDKPDAWDAWNVGLTGTEFPSVFRSARIVERGPVRVVLRLERDFLKPGVKKEFPTEDFPTTFFTQDVVLYAGSDRVEFVTTVDWWEEKTMLKVAFPVAVADDVATYEIPFGSIERSTRLDDDWQKAKVEVPAQRWADLSQDDYGVTLINTSKYGYDIKGNTIRLSLLRSPVWPDPTADRGKHVIEYALYPHPKRWRDAATVRQAYERNHPLIAIRDTRHSGKLPPRHSFVGITPGDLVLTTLKRSEDSDAWILGWYDARGEGATATITLPSAVKKAFLSNILEEDLAPLAIDGRTVKVPTPRKGAVTVKVQM